ncbi:MAG: Holliday junction DNA helicase RuvA [Chlamydiae bacterium RIFCSPHIGHO2_12_FULL_27_8]|nr:MAG: Holliday junction DNA helicase RuvA [Chlamydiae bacterium RIFCSPHIGHO2_12_FULL_27_8]
MFEYFIGKVVEIDNQKVILDVNGIGYKIFVPQSFQNELQNSENLKVYVYLAVKEDSHTLYGFSTKLQKDIFEILISVSGIGAKTAILILSYLDIENLYSAISNADVKLLSKIPHVGKKTAERLILELKDKFKVLDTKIISNQSKTQNYLISDAINALMNLGYSVSQANKAVQSITKDEKDLTLSQLITKALQKI